MRKTILKLMLVTLVLMPACNRKHTDTTFTVTGKIENVVDGYMVLFFKSNDDGSTVTIDIDTLVNGRFEFTAPAESGVQYHVMAPHTGIFPSMSVDFYAKPGADVKIHGKDYLTKNWKVSHAGKDQKIYRSYFNQVADVFKDLQTLELECRREGRALDYLEHSEPYNEKIDSIRLTWLKKHKRISHPWMDLMLGSAKSASFSKDKKTMNDLKKIWNRVPHEHKTSPKGKQISIVLYPDGEPLKAGDEFPYETKVYDLEGNGHSLEEFKGKLLLLYFSSHGCKPCIGVKKELEEIFISGESPVEIIGFNLDGEKTWKAGAKYRSTLWPEFNELKGSHGLFRRFEAPGVPTFVIVSEEGIILDIWTGHQHGKLLERINEALKKE